MQNFLLDFLQVNAIFNASDEMHYRECKGFIECFLMFYCNCFDWCSDYCAGIGTLPNYHHYELLVKYHKKLIRDDILLNLMSNETEEKRNYKPIYKEKNHFVGIEFSFERRKWLWNTNDEVEDKFWLQSKAGFINYAEPQLLDKLVYTMSEQSTDPSVDSIQDSSLQYFIEILHPLVCHRSWMWHLFLKALSAIRNGFNERMSIQYIILPRTQFHMTRIPNF